MRVKAWTGGSAPAELDKISREERALVNTLAILGALALIAALVAQIAYELTRRD